MSLAEIEAELGRLKAAVRCYVRAPRDPFTPALYRRRILRQSGGDGTHAILSLFGVEPTQKHRCESMVCLAGIEKGKQRTRFLIARDFLSSEKN